MITVCSIFDTQYFRGKVLRTSIGVMAGMDAYTDKECEWMYPEWWMVKGHKAGTVSDQEYKDAYRELLMGKLVNGVHVNSRQVQIKAWMDNLKVDEDLTLLCYCKEGAFCHRRILASMIRFYRPDIEVVVH